MNLRRTLAIGLLALLAVPVGTAAVALAQEKQYQENLYEITDFGVFDPEGNRVGVAPSSAPAPEAAAPAQPTAEAPALPDEPQIDPQFEAYRKTVMESWGGERGFAEKRLQGARDNLHEELDRFSRLEKQIDEAESRLAPLRAKSNTLKEQIGLYNEQLRTTKEKIVLAEIATAEKTLEIQALMRDLEVSRASLDVQRQETLDFIRMLYSEEGRFLDWGGEQSSTLKLLLADGAVSENLLGRDYMVVMEETGRRMFHTLEQADRQLQEKEDAVAQERAHLERLYGRLTLERRTLQEERLGKKDLLASTQGEEERYQKLLEESIQQQLESALSIQNLKENIGWIESQLATLEDKTKAVEETKTPEELNVLEGALTARAPLEWPVPPNVITAGFHDPAYPKEWGVHQAIDIRAPQFTEIHAPANGYVFQTKDNGMGYSYMILVHKNSLVTVYGHVAEFKVKAGQLVQKGDVIGLTGGTPGTRGAGMQTTGPHLHFEVHFKGQPVDPLLYLPEQPPLEPVSEPAKP